MRTYRPCHFHRHQYVAGADMPKRWLNHFLPSLDDLARLERIETKLDQILANQENQMAAIDDELAAIKGSLDTIQTGVTALLAKIAAMPTAGLTPEQQTALDSINAEAKAIATAATTP